MDSRKRFEQTLVRVFTPGPEMLSALDAAHIYEKVAWIDGVDYGCLVVQRRPYVCVCLASKPDYQAVGFSKVMFPDEWSLERGVEVALKRACRNMSHRIVECMA